MLRSCALAAGLVCAMWFTAHAAEGEGEQQEGDAKLTVVHGEGDYQGVAPGQGRDKSVPAPPRRKPKGPTVTWIGFQPLDGGSSRVFVQVSSTFTFDQKMQGDELVISIPEVKLGNYNFSRFMDTSFFDTALARIKAERHGRGKHASGVELHIKFKGGKARQADAHQETSQDGYNYLFLDFGPSG